MVWGRKARSGKVRRPEWQYAGPRESFIHEFVKGVTISAMSDIASSVEPDFALSLAEMAVTSEALVTAESLNEILHRLAQRAQEVTHADYAAISVFDEEGRVTRFVYTGIDEAAARRLGNPPVGRGLLGELRRHDRPLRLDNLKAHPRFTGWPEGHPDMEAFLGVPVRAGGQTIGSLYMTRVAGREPFTEHDELAAAVLALQAAATVASALARERTGRVAILEERERIAHDLHDGIIQSLYAIGLEFDTLTQRDDLPADARELLKEEVERINAIIQDIREYISMLEAGTPPSAPDLSRDLAFVLRQLVPPGVDTVLNVTAAALQELTSRDAEDLLYIAREAVSNAARHGSPSKVAVDLRQTDTELTLTVQDNGVGFDPATAPVGLGTITMRTRAARLGAKLTVLGIPGMGTTVHLSIPRRGYERATGE